MSEADQLTYKYSSYIEQGHLVLAVTLTTNVYDDQFAASPSMRSFVEMYVHSKIDRYLAFKQRGKFDFDYVVEQSPGGLWHFHGLLALPAEAGKRIWTDCGLNPRLRRDLNSMRVQGSLRPCILVDYEIEPIRDGAAGIKSWTRYITKTSTYISSGRDSWHNSKIVLGTSGSSPAWMKSLRRSVERLQRMRQR